jgi:hypothetical protein
MVSQKRVIAAGGEVEVLDKINKENNQLKIIIEDLVLGPYHLTEVNSLGYISFNDMKGSPKLLM